MIKAEGLTKQYGTLTAVDDLSFKVEPGEVLGFLGPNGAGKTTTMRMFAGFVAAHGRHGGSLRLSPSPRSPPRPSACWATCPKVRPPTAR